MSEQVTVDRQAYSPPNRSSVPPEKTAAALVSSQPQLGHPASSPQHLCLESPSTSSSVTLNSVNGSSALMPVAQGGAAVAYNTSDSSNSHGSSNVYGSVDERQGRQGRHSTSNTQPQLRSIIGGSSDTIKARAAPAATHMLTSSQSESRGTHMGLSGKTSQPTPPTSRSPEPHAAAGSSAEANAAVSLTEDNRGFLFPEYTRDLSSEEEEVEEEGAGDANPVSREEHDTVGNEEDASACVHAPSLAIFPLTTDERQAVSDAYGVYAAEAVPSRQDLVNLLRALYAKAHVKASETETTGMSSAPSAAELLRRAETSLGTIRFRGLIRAFAKGRPYCANRQHRGSNGSDQAASLFTLEDAFCFLGVLKFGLASYLFEGSRKDRREGEDGTAATTSSETGSKDAPAASPLAPAPVSVSQQTTESHRPPCMPTAGVAAAPPTPPPVPLSPTPPKTSLSSVLSASPLAFLQTTAVTRTPPMRPGTRPPHSVPSLSASPKSAINTAPGVPTPSTTHTPINADPHRPPPSSSPPPSSQPTKAAREALDKPSVQQGSIHARRQRRQRMSTSAHSNGGGPKKLSSTAPYIDAMVRTYVQRSAFAELTEKGKDSRRCVSLERLVEALRLFELALNPVAIARVCSDARPSEQGEMEDVSIDFPTFVKIMEAGLQHPLEGSRRVQGRLRGSDAADVKERSHASDDGDDTVPDMFLLDLHSETRGGCGGTLVAVKGSSEAGASSPWFEGSNSGGGGGGGVASVRDSLLSSKSAPSTGGGTAHRPGSRSRSNSSLATSVVSFTKSLSDTDDTYPVIVTRDSAMAALCREIRWRLRTAAHRSVREHAGPVASERQLPSAEGSVPRSSAGDGALPPPPPPPPPPPSTATQPAATSMQPFSNSDSVSATSSSSYSIACSEKPRRELVVRQDHRGHYYVAHAEDTTRGGRGQYGTNAAAPTTTTTRRRHPAVELFAAEPMSPREAFRQWRREMVPPPSAAQWTAPHPYGPPQPTAQPSASARAANDLGHDAGRRRSSTSTCSSSSRGGQVSSLRRPRDAHQPRRPRVPFQAPMQATPLRRGQHPSHPAANAVSTVSPLQRSSPPLLMHAASAARPPRRRPPRWEQMAALSPYFGTASRPLRSTGVYAHLGGATRTYWRATHYSGEAVSNTANSLPPHVPAAAVANAAVVPMRPPSPGHLHPRRPASASSSLRSSRSATAASAAVVQSTSAVTSATAAAAAAAAATHGMSRTPQQQTHMPMDSLAVLTPSPQQPLISSFSPVRLQRPPPAHGRRQDRQRQVATQGRNTGGRQRRLPNVESSASAAEARGRTMPPPPPPSPPHQYQQHSTAHLTNGAGEAATYLPVISPHRMRREWLLSELSELYAEHKALTQRLAALSTVATSSPTLPPPSPQQQHQQQSVQSRLSAAMGSFSRQARQCEAVECEVALNEVSRRIHRYLAELAVDGPISNDAYHCADLRYSQESTKAKKEEELWRKEEHFAFVVAEPCQAAFIATQHVARSPTSPESVGPAMPRPPRVPVHEAATDACPTGQALQRGKPISTAPPSLEEGDPSREMKALAGAVDKRRRCPQGEGPHLAGPTLASPRDRSPLSGSPDVGGQHSDRDDVFHSHSSYSSSPSPLQDSLQASTVPLAADSVHSRLRQQPQLPTTLSVRDSSTCAGLTEPLSAPKILHGRHSSTLSGSPKFFQLSNADADELGRSPREPSAIDQPSSTSLSPKVAKAALPAVEVLAVAAAASAVEAASSAAAALATATASTVATTVAAPHTPRREGRRSGSVALPGFGTGSSVALPPLRTSPYSSPMMRARGSSSSTTTGTTTATSLSSTAAVAAAALGLHNSASALLTGAMPPASATAAAMEAAGGMYDDDSPSPRANVYLEWAVAQNGQRPAEQQQQQQQQHAGSSDHTAHTGSATGSSTARVKSVVLPHASNSSVHHAHTLTGSSGPATVTTTTATTNSSWTTSRAFCAPSMFSRPPMSANRSTASSGRALPNSLNASKPGSGNSESGMASLLIERQSSSLPAPLAAENDTMRSDDRTVHERGSMTTPADEALLLGFSAGDRNALLRRGLAAAGSFRSHASPGSHVTNTSLGSNSIMQASGVSAPLDFMGSTTWSTATQSRGGGQALRSGHSSTLYRMARSSARQYGGYDNQRSYSAFERTVSSIVPAGFSGSMFPQRDADGNIIHEED